MKARLISITAVAALLITGAGCDGDDNDDNDDESGVPNPAAVHCEEQGGTTSGPEPMCELPDGTVVDAWEYFRSETGRGAGVANPASVFCEAQGGVESGPEPMCELPDGTVVDAWEYFRETAPAR